MNKLIQLSDRHVEEHCVKSIARISANPHLLHKSLSKFEFKQDWIKSNDETDLSRAPQIRVSPLSLKIREQIASFGELKGVLPKY